MLALDLIGLAGEHEDPAQTLVLHPHDGGTRALDEELRHVDVGSPLGHPHEVVVKLVLGVGGDDDGPRLFLRDVGQDIAPQVLEPLVGEAESARGEERVAAPLGLRRLLDHQHRRPRLPRGQRGAQRGIASPDHHHIMHGHAGSPSSVAAN
jgi:hypothetical protein